MNYHFGSLSILSVKFKMARFFLIYRLDLFRPLYMTKKLCPVSAVSFGENSTIFCFDDATSKFRGVKPLKGQLKMFPPVLLKYFGVDIACVTHYEPMLADYNWSWIWMSRSCKLVQLLSFWNQWGEKIENLRILEFK